jgi:hypothetical protein
MTKVSRFFASSALPAVVGLALLPSLACSSTPGNAGTGGTTGTAGSGGTVGTGGSGGTVGTGGSGGTVGTGGSGGTAGSGGTGDGTGGSNNGPDGGPCPAPTARPSKFLSVYYELRPCDAPPAANVHWTAEAGWSDLNIQNISLGNDRLVADSSAGYDIRRGASGWTTTVIVPGSDPSVSWAAVDGDTFAYRTVYFQDSHLLVGNWNGSDMGASGHALSGDTLVTTNRVFVNAAGTWAPSSTISPPDTTGTTGAVALGHDRFALLRATETRIIQRQGDAWTDLGSLPAAKSVAMAPASAPGTWLVLSAKDAVGGAFPVSLFTLGAAGWQSQATIDVPADTASGSGAYLSVTQPLSDALGDLGVIVVSGGPATLIFTRDSAGVVRAQDRIPLQGKAIVSGKNLAILSANAFVAGTTVLRPLFVYRSDF